MRFPVRYGGQGVSHVASTILEEMWQAANPGFALCPMLTSSAIAALLGAGSDELKKRYLPKLVAGVWTGSMNLTDHTGSNLGAEESKVIRQTDGSYRIFGQNNFIIYGDHDLAENVIHLVLARSRDGQRGVESVSLFVVPKMLFDEKARVGPKNDVRCVSLKEKLGIHASPTAVMLFGERNGAAAEIVGEEGRGLEYMSLMMDEARFSVGIQGLGMAERAFQRALAYAADRIRGEAFANSGLSTILGDPHVRRLLLSMKSNI